MTTTIDWDVIAHGQAQNTIRDSIGNLEDARVVITDSVNSLEQISIDSQDADQITFTADTRGINLGAVSVQITQITDGFRRLQMAGDTWIDVPAAVLDNSQDNTVEYNFRITDTQLTRDNWIWSNVTADATRISGARFRASDASLRSVRSTNYHSWEANPPRYEDNHVIESWSALIRTLSAQVNSVVQTPVSLPNNALTTETGLRFGRRYDAATTSWLIGQVWDVKIYNAVGTLIHHWPIDDDVADGGEITDIVGGAHGVLNLGGGSWVYEYPAVVDLPVTHVKNLPKVTDGLAMTTPLLRDRLNYGPTDPILYNRDANIVRYVLDPSRAVGDPTVWPMDYWFVEPVIVDVRTLTTGATRTLTTGENRTLI